MSLRRISILLFAALLVAAGCTQPSAPGASNQPSASAGGAASTLVWYADTSDLISLDPAVAYEFTGVLLAHNAYETLVKFEGADLSTIKPALAQSWDIKDSGSQWDITFKLRSGAKFASGNAITADDVVYSFQRVLKLNKSPAFLFTDIAQLKDTSIKASDPSTVVISLPKTASPQGFLAVLTFTIGSVVDSKEVKTKESGGDSGSTYLLDHSLGSGAYVIDHWTKNSEVQLKANTQYGGSPKPALSGVLVKHVPEQTNQQFALERGDADIVRNLGAQQIAALQGKQGVATTSGNSLQLVYVGMNVTVKPLDNVNVREALRTAVDYDGIVKDLLKGGAKKVQGIVPAGLAGYNESTPFQADVTKAKSLMQQAGQTAVTLELLVPTGPAPGGATFADLAAKLQSDWKNIGVTVNIKQTTQADLLGTYRAQKGQLVMIYWGPDFPDPDANVGPFTDYGAKSIAFRNGWNDAIATKGRDAALITDTTKRAAAYKEITDYVLHNGPYVILYQPTEPFGLRSNVKGFVWSPMDWTDFAAISK
ncbi:MAG: ABC transporter substrate-binding protein [Chloroflexi bacterium]|nr:MAG: ABC transporter substrate-binding protein [Chloroflexota bacterium]